MVFVSYDRSGAFLTRFLSPISTRLDYPVSLRIDRPIPLSPVAYVKSNNVQST
jgi:hypothetical protein